MTLHLKAMEQVFNVISVLPFGRKTLWLAILIGSLAGVCGERGEAQEPTAASVRSPQKTATDDEELSPVSAKVEITPGARDEEIRGRLQNVLDATGWFTDSKVQVTEGVVFLDGQVETEELKKWAGDLARGTQDVVAVLNRMEVIEPSVWDFRPAWGGLLSLWRDVIRSLPFLAFGLLILAMAFGAAILVTRSASGFLKPRIQAKLLRAVIARGIGLLTFLVGVYVVLRVSGLTQLALTVVGGTGLIGLAVGIAFRDITENFLASIFLSMQKPFETGDLVDVTGVTGYVQQLNVRTTILMTLEGNIVQIPNASVYKNNIRNFTTNSNRREVFDVGIGYDDSINDAQEIVREVLANHPAILDDPEPSVLVESLRTSTVNLRVYFWLNGREHSWLKVRSSAIRLVKIAFQKHGISMPDEAREVVFPKGLPVTLLESSVTESREAQQDEDWQAGVPPSDPAAVATKAEGGLSSEAEVIKSQARQVQPLHDGENLLSASRDETSPY